MANRFQASHNAHRVGVLDGILFWVGKTKPAELETRHYYTSFNKEQLNSSLTPICKPKGFTELHLQAWLAHPQELQQLVEQGAEVNAADAKGRTALHIAAMRGSRESVEFLLEAGADIAAKDWQGNKPLRYAQGNRQQLLDFLDEIGVLEQLQ